MTSSDFNAILGLYDYAFPERLIAKEPAHPRDAARLMIVDRAAQSAEPIFDTFANIHHHLPANAVLVFNETRVIPARMRLTKSTGGTVEALFTEEDADCLRVIASGSFKPGDTLRWTEEYSFTVEERTGKEALLRPSFALARLHELLDRHGETPLPPYMKDSPLTEARRREEYQTLFAHHPGSVAAPTAGLHFTENLITKIEQKGIDVRYVTLHVNLGTFAPLTEEHLRTKKLHRERYAIDPATAAFLNEAKALGRPIVAVGTTTVRTLESAARDGRLQNLSGITDIFLTEDDRPRFVDGLVTNFHVPRSSLLMLVASFTGRERLMRLYETAITEECRLFSFGDGMLIM